MCDADQAHTFLEGGDLLYGGGERFRLVTCSNCGHIYQNPRPTPAAIGAYYPNNYISFPKAIEDETKPWKRFDRRVGQRRRALALHRACGRSGRVLDIGCATGMFLDGMRRLGWETQGIEPSETAAAYARERMGLDVVTGLLEDTHFPDASFDAVTMWDVLEHVHEPRAVLQEIARLLQPGGVLLLSLPNPDSLEARLIGRHWLGWDLPRHLNLFRPLQLREHLAHVGLHVSQICSFTAGYSVLLLSLEQRLIAQGKNTTRLMHLLRSWPMRVLAMPYYAGPAKWFNLSSIMVVFARKSDGTFQINVNKSITY